MTCTSSTKQHRRRLATAILALPLTLAMTGTAFATGPSDSLGASTAEVRTSSDAVRSNAADASSPADKPAPDKAAVDRSAADKAAAAARPADRAPEAKPDKPSAGSAAGAASGKSAAAATAPTTTPTTSYVNGNTNSSKAERPNAPVTQSAAPSQPISKADSSGNGANPGSAQQCATLNPYCSNGTGVEPGNGNDSAPAKGQPCAGCVGKADNKYPAGQAPGGSDRNNGYECDGNQGIGQMNPAHTGCRTSPPAVVDLCPDVDGVQTALPCRKVVVDLCPDVDGVQTALPCKEDDNGGVQKITICHATSSDKNPLVVIEPSVRGVLDGHEDHENDVIPAFTYVDKDGKPQSFSGKNVGKPCDVKIVDVCLDMTGDQPAGTTCSTGGGGNPPFDQCLNISGNQPAGTDCGGGSGGGFDQCPNISGNQPAGTDCGGGGGGSGGGNNPSVDVCPDVLGMQLMGPCATSTSGGGTPVQNPPASGGGTPLVGTPVNLPVSGPAPVVGPPTVVPPVIVPQGTRPAVLIGAVDSRATRPAAQAAAPRALPFTGTDAALLAELGVLLLLVGGGVLVAARRERTARAA